MLFGLSILFTVLLGFLLRTLVRRHGVSNPPAPLDATQNHIPSDSIHSTHSGSEAGLDDAPMPSDQTSKRGQSDSPSANLTAEHGLAESAGPPGPNPVSVNYHFTRKCNRTCGFCFHTAKASHPAPLTRPNSANLNLPDLLRPPTQRSKTRPLPPQIRRHGKNKLRRRRTLPLPQDPRTAPRLLQAELQLDSVSIVSNGTLIKERFLREYGKHIDILAVSCDSFDEATNVKIGRGDGYNVARLREIAGWCRQYGVMFKMNSVICRYNVNEDMAANIAEIGPFRWKCFQVLVQPGENDSDTSLRDAREFVITDEEFDGFCEKHKHLKCFVPEPNRLMAASYLILDEYMCFLNKERDVKSESILRVGGAEAMQKVNWDESAFEERGGVYEWSKGSGEGGADAVGDGGGCGGSGGNGELEW